MKAWKLVYILPILLFSQSLFAMAYNCKSTDDTITVFLHPDTNVLKIDGTSYVTKKSDDPNLICQTEPFKTNDFGTVYITVGNTPNMSKHITINQVAVSDGAIKASLDVKCEMAE